MSENQPRFAEQSARLARELGLRAFTEHEARQVEQLSIPVLAMLEHGNPQATLECTALAAELVGRDPGSDLALLRVAAAAEPYLGPGTSR